MNIKSRPFVVAVVGFALFVVLTVFVIAPLENRSMQSTLDLQEDILVIEEANADDVGQAHKEVVARWENDPIKDAAFIDIYQAQLVEEGNLSVESCPILVQKMAAYYICSNPMVEITWFGNSYSFPAPAGSRVAIAMDGYLWVDVYLGEEKIARYEFYEGEIFLP